MRKGFFVKLEHHSPLKPVTEDKYSYLIQCLTPAVCDCLGSYLDEPGQPGVDYKNLKEELTKIYARADLIRCKEVMAIRSMGDKSPEKCKSEWQNGIVPGPQSRGRGFDPWS